MVWTRVLVVALAASALACSASSTSSTSSTGSRGQGQAGAAAQRGYPVSADWDFEYARQFDFWIGEWDVNLRTIQEDLTWKDTYQAKAEIYPLLQGKAILELWDEAQIKGFSLRYFDRDKGKWVLWLNWPGKNRSGISTLEGEFRHGRGEFFQPFTSQDGKAGISRYSFNDITPTSLRWDDAYTVDGGKTWSGNWIMEFSRTAALPSLPQPGQPAHTFHTGERCDLDGFRSFDFLEGQFNGSVQIGSQTLPAQLEGFRVLDGCAVITLMHYGTQDDRREVFSFTSFNTYAERLEELLLDDRPGTIARQLYGEEDASVLSLTERSPGELKREWSLNDTGFTLTEFSGSDATGWTEKWRASFSAASSGSPSP